MRIHSLLPNNCCVSLDSSASLDDATMVAGRCAASSWAIAGPDSTHVDDDVPPVCSESTDSSRKEIPLHRFTADRPIKGSFYAR